MTSQGQRDATREMERFEDLMPKQVDRGVEFSKLLESRRLEARDRPFVGFHSPPGRF